MSLLSNFIIFSLSPFFQLYNLSAIFIYKLQCLKKEVKDTFLIFLRYPVEFKKTLDSENL